MAFCCRRTPSQVPEAKRISVSALRVENVYKVFGRRSQEAIRRINAGASRDEVKTLGTAAVIDASFEVKAGETFVVMGLSGSGKSTLIRMLNGLLEPSAGKIYIGDDEITSVSASQLREIRRKRISMVFQHFALRSEERRVGKVCRYHRREYA